MAFRLALCVVGTLVRSVGLTANRLHREAFSAAFQSVCGLTTDIDVVQHHGSTDTLILVAVLQFHGVDKDTVSGMM